MRRRRREEARTTRKKAKNKDSRSARRTHAFRRLSYKEDVTVRVK